MNPKLLTIVRILAIILVIGLTVLLYIYRDQVSQLGAFGYPGIFLVSMLSNASIILPIPGVLFTSAMGAVFNPWWVSLAAGSGATLGELSGLYGGFQRAGNHRESRVVQQGIGLDKKIWRYHHLCPGVDTQSTLRYRWNGGRGFTDAALAFSFWCWLGKIGKMLIFAFGGSSVLSLFGL